MSTESDLVAKLVQTNHLDAIERKQLPLGCAKWSLVRQRIADLISKNATFPIGREVTDSFVGCLITHESDGAWRVYWKVEASISAIALKEVWTFHSMPEAIDHFIAREYEHGIDGIPIDRDL